MQPQQITLYTQNFAKIVLVQLSASLAQIEFHFFYEEYYDYFADYIQQFKNQVVRFVPDIAQTVDSVVFGRSYMIDNIVIEKKTDDNLLFGDSWLNIVLLCIPVTIDGVVPMVDPLDSFDNVFNYERTGQFTINADNLELNPLLRLPIQKIVTQNDNEIILNDTITSITFIDESN